MKTSTTVTVTRKELELITKHGSDLMKLLSEEFGLDDKSEELQRILTTEVQMSTKVSSVFGSVKYKLRLTDSITLTNTLEISEVGIEKLLELGDAVVDYVLPIFKAFHTLTKNHEGIQRIKTINSELNEMASSNVRTFETKAVNCK